MADSRRIITLYDEPMWESIAAGSMKLQCCSQCSAFRYPPGPICSQCHSMDYQWSTIAGGGEVLSWVVFHRQYFDDHPQPYNAVAIRLDEGPIVVSNLVGPTPGDGWIGQRVTITYQTHLDRTQHAFMLAQRP